MDSWNKFKEVDDARDPVSLLKQIKLLCRQHDTTIPLHNAKDIAKRNFYNYKQGDHESVAMHANNVKALYDVIRH